MQSTDTIRAITNLLFLETPLKQVDLIFVFGNHWLDTTSCVLNLWKQNLAPKILITGNSPNPNVVKPESQYFLEKAVELGIPQEVILIEDKATNTKENIIFSLQVLEKNIGMDNIHSMMFVCKAFHTRRVLMTAQKYFPKDIEYLFFPTYDERNISKDSWWKSPQSFERVMKELSRISEYSLKGDISIL